MFWYEFFIAFLIIFSLRLLSPLSSLFPSEFWNFDRWAWMNLLILRLLSTLVIVNRGRRVSWLVYKNVFMTTVWYYPEIMISSACPDVYRGTPHSSLPHPYQVLRQVYYNGVQGCPRLILEEGDRIFGFWRNIRFLRFFLLIWAKRTIDSAWLRNSRIALSECLVFYRHIPSGKKKSGWKILFCHREKVFQKTINFLLNGNNVDRNVSVDKFYVEWVWLLW